MAAAVKHKSFATAIAILIKKVSTFWYVTDLITFILIAV